MSRSIIEHIRAEDPSYDPLAAALAASGVSREEFIAAYDRVVVDGNFGPLSPADWREQDGREPATVPAALEVLGKVSEAIDDYRVEAIACADCGDDGTECDELVEVSRVDADDIRRDLFASVVEIYGHLPF